MCRRQCCTRWLHDFRQVIPCGHCERVDLQAYLPTACITTHSRDEYLFENFADIDDVVDLSIPLDKLFEELPQMCASVPCLSA